LCVLKTEKAPLLEAELVFLLANKKTHFVASIKYFNAHGWAFLIPKPEKTTISCETEGFFYSVLCA
jgi:hypothetical protein